MEKINENEYKNCIEDNGTKYSIDMMRLNFKLHKGKSQGLLDYLGCGLSFDFEHYTTSKMAGYRENFIIKCPNDNTYWLGVGFNGTRTEPDKVCIEYNPNKVGGTAPLVEVLNYLKINCKYVDVARFDLACDLPISRDRVFLRRDTRRYECVGHGHKVDTEYLGQRNTVGRVKLYNKSAESGLPYPLTRLEITLDDTVTYEQFASRILPVVYLPNNMQVTLAEVESLSDTELYILDKILENPSEITRLSRKMRKKIEPFVNAHYKSLSVSRDVYTRIISQVAKEVKEISYLSA